MQYRSVFYPTEMDLYDALFSNSQKVTTRYLLELARDRGIFLSPDDERETLARSISLLDHDYYQFKQVSDFVARSSRAEKTSSTILEATISEDQIGELYKLVCAERAVFQERLSITSLDEQTTHIDISYDEIDHSKTTLIQKVTGEGGIDLIRSGGKVKIRYTASNRVADIKESVVKNIEKIAKKKVDKVEIDFSGVPDTRQRTIFFTRLISEIVGYTMLDVSKVKVNTKTHNDSFEDEEAEKIEDELSGFISKATFDGSSLLNSPLYKEMAEKGYFITSIRWIAEEISKTPNRVEFDAMFEDGDECSGFRYSVHGVYRHKSNGYTQLRPAQKDEEKNLIAKVEIASVKVYSEMLRELAEGA